MNQVPEKYEPEQVNPQDLAGWLGWSLDFFADPTVQNPYLDVTLQLDVTSAYAGYQSEPEIDDVQGTFFAYLIWNLAQTLSSHPSFNYRYIDDKWYLLHNPPIFVPVAVGGDARFGEVVLENTYRQDYPTFLQSYRQKLHDARNPNVESMTASDVMRYAHFMGNLPQLHFTALTLHWRPDQMVGQSLFYFGQRRHEEGRVIIPLAVKMHHANTDLLVVNELLMDFAARW